MSAKKGVGGGWGGYRSRAKLRHLTQFPCLCLHLSVGLSARGLTHLHGQTDGVEKDEREHQVLEVGGVDHIPHLVLVRVLGDVAAQWTRLQGVLHTLALG